MKRRAFISVYDKTGIIDFAKNLVEKFDYEIVAGRSTYEFLKSADIDVINIGSSANKFLPPEYTALNENVLAGILSNTSDSRELTYLENDAIKSFDLVVVNLCPVEKLTENSESIEEFTKKIDIVGCTLLRAGAKNFRNVTVITNKEDYYVAMNSNEFGRMKLAAKAYNLTSEYDKFVSEQFSEQSGGKLFKSFNFEKLKELDHGENPQQKASLYKTQNMVDYEVLYGKQLTYNNYLNITEAVNLVSEFYDVNCVSIVRHTKPCGVALGRSLYEAYTKAFDCDPISSYYGVVGFSQKVDAEVAKHLNSMSIDVVVAPDYDEKAIEIFEDNHEIKLVKLNTPLREYKRFARDEIVISPFGALIQEKNESELDKDMFQVVTREKPTQEQIEDAVFAWKVVKYAKTNAVVIARDFKTFAISQGFTNNISAIDNALNYSCDASKDAVLASDSVIMAEDSLYAAIQGRINLIIQPGGSVKDQKLIEICDKYGISMITTGIRNYRQ